MKNWILSFKIESTQSVMTLILKEEKENRFAPFSSFHKVKVTSHSSWERWLKCAVWSCFLFYTGDGWMIVTMHGKYSRWTALMYPSTSNTLHAHQIEENKTRNKSKTPSTADGERTIKEHELYPPTTGNKTLHFPNFISTVQHTPIHCRHAKSFRI